MHTIELTETREIEVTHLHARCGVRYWEDATVNGEEDTDGGLIPLREGDCWCPTIELDTGKVKDWPNGVTADIHYKVCDAGEYQLLNADGITVVEKDGYVPNIMSPCGEGYGDYVIMEIDGEGQIQNWDVDLRYFED